MMHQTGIVLHGKVVIGSWKVFTRGKLSTIEADVVFAYSCLSAPVQVDYRILSMNAVIIALRD